MPLVLIIHSSSCLYISFISQLVLSLCSSIISLLMVLPNSFSWKALFLFRINILIFTFLLEPVLSSNSTRYEACKPTNCGTCPNISFPFYVFGRETDHCGYPGLGIVCNRSKPIYKFSKRKYVIQDIFYENQTIRLVDEEFVNDSCFAYPCKFSIELSFLEFTRTFASLLFQTQILFFINIYI